KGIIASGGNVDALVSSFLGTNHSRLIEFCLLTFSNLAVASSFFGVTLGLFDFLADLFKFDNSFAGRFKTILLTFLPPAILYMFFPNGFIYGIGGAGLCATIWAVIIPAVLAIKSRQKFPDQIFTVWGGRIIPAMVIIFGIVVIFCWFGNVFNILPRLG
ncbi:TPA: aromatic amino acid transport family protein, partial [Salmonella enterica subsp. enterica serovar 6,7:y:-]